MVSMQLWNFMFIPIPGNKRENSKTTISMRCVCIHISMQCVCACVQTTNSIIIWGSASVFDVCMCCVCVSNKYSGAWFEDLQFYQDRVQPSGLCKATISAVALSRSLSPLQNLLITVYIFDSSNIKKTVTTRFVISLET